MNPPDHQPRVEVEDLGRFHAGDLSGAGLERFTATAVTLWKHVFRVWVLTNRKADMNELGFPAKPFPAALVGRGWSFSGLIGADRGKKRESMLLCEGLAGSVMVPPQDLADPAQAGHIAVTGGGTRFRELLDWAFHHGRSVMTSGTHLGATVAGAIATATHGSRLGYGGMQDMIVGLHIVTGVGESVWLERHSEAVLTDDGAKKLAPSVRIIRDDAMFEDAVVHLGCMGIINCAAIRLIEDKPYDVVKRDKAVDMQWLKWVDDGEWREIARWLGHDAEPIFYEVTLSPHDWSGSTALHILYFENDGRPSCDPESAHPQPRLSAGDAIVRFGATFSVRKSAALNQAFLKKLPDLDLVPFAEGDDDDRRPTGHRKPPPAEMRVFDPTSNATSAYDYYRVTGGFQTGGTIERHRTWREIHADEITGGYPGSLYNASYAIERDKVSTALPAIARTVRHLPMSFVFTIRFVSKPAGTLAFTRFPENAVIEIDGLSPWICRRTRSRLSPASDTYWQDRKMLDYLENTLPYGAHQVKRALDAQNVAFSNHFGKRSFLDRRKIERDFKAGIDRWRATRDAILGDLGKAIFWNWGAVNFGLLPRPVKMPPAIPPFSKPCVEDLSPGTVLLIGDEMAPDLAEAVSPTGEAA